MPVGKCMGTSAPLTTVVAVSQPQIEESKWEESCTDLRKEVLQVEVRGHRVHHGKDIVVLFLKNKRGEPSFPLRFKRAFKF
ncbi:hypothetical protein Pyn_33021 [Prunus yedoensis var. nudiflora]|uniref:Uncharacterized protein n=1 Tax=Prunus yedoensis var. nudiflora TaxID=2094558 RepID=A0A314ZBA1_PRUYE|nr:hypothetical protein Pyn_33021 [Prunus yedoensis var. nudiflora]